jgi:hypothetical protein
MKRRDFLKTLIVSLIGAGVAPEVLARHMRFPLPSFSQDADEHIKDYLNKMKNFNKPHKDDILLKGSELKTFKSVVKRLRHLQQLVGYGNFQILSFDQGIKFARKYSELGEFPQAELTLLEKIFYTEAAQYGFFGQKPLGKITNKIKTKEIIKIPRTGNYLYKDSAVETFWKVKQQLGDQAILTSGVRGIMKQFMLFLNKAYQNQGNLSLASRSLAPPGYSFHGIGDFDVGQIGFGIDNFTERFTTSEVYRRLSELGYLTLRYTEKNLLGVRFEPWHIKMKTA